MPAMLKENRPWTDAELEHLRDLRRQGWSYYRIGKAIERSERATANKAKEIAATVPEQPPKHPKSSEPGNQASRAGTHTLDPLPSLAEPMYVIPKR